ncbi:MAG: hypothetical protein HY291_04085 [Planctomycetes bacterium]|nr:hypothetical protein [Planctomycetota bacterium]
MAGYRRLFLGVLLAWPILWVPIAFVFNHDNYPPVFAWLAPGLGFYAIFNNGWEGSVYNNVTLPWMVFWLVALGIGALWGLAELVAKSFRQPPPKHWIR